MPGFSGFPFDKPGRFWKGNLHTHTTRSDGRVAPEQVCALYRQAGYHFLALTDHFLGQYAFPITDARRWDTSEFITLLGAELHAGETELGNLWHILSVGLPADFAATSPDESGPALAARALQTGAYVAAAHPYWYGLTEADICSLGPIHAVEIYNGVSDDYSDRAESWYILDLLSARGLRYFALATDDAHFNPAHHGAMRGWVHVKSETLTPEAILSALKQGLYYSSTGPQIFNVEVHPGDKVVVSCYPASRIFITGRQHFAASAYGNGITRAELSLKSFASPYCRVTVRDAQGGRAWSNPIWFSEP